MLSTERFETLDALRGIAALSVVFHHCLISLPIFFAAYAPAHSIEARLRPTHGWPALMIDSPLHVTWGGHEAVILFFVLSGFVLFLPFSRQQAFTYQGYFIRRFCRIYLPYLFIITLSAILMFWITPREIPELSHWINTQWSRAMDWQIIVDQLLMVGKHTHVLNTATWSLVHEMRISLIFPLIAWFTLKRNWQVVLGAAFILSLFCNFSFFQEAIPGTVLATGHYAAFFMLGSVVSKNRTILCERIKRFPRLAIVAIFIAALILFNAKWQFGRIYLPSLETHRLYDWPVAVASVVFILFAMSQPLANRILSQQWALWLGKVSFSLYLGHVLVLLTLLHTLGRHSSPLLAIVLTPILSIPTAALLYRFVELPTSTLGRRWSNRIVGPG